jgi:electron transfer flavoprotein beta subunit
VASHLDLPQITYVRKIEEISDENVVAERLLENGYEAIESPLPCVLTCVKEINEPRLPSLKGKMKAKKAEIVTWSAADIDADPKKIGLDGSPTKVVKIFTPPQREGGEIFQGEPHECARKLAEALKETVIAANS